MQQSWKVCAGICIVTLVLMIGYVGFTHERSYQDGRFEGFKQGQERAYAYMRENGSSWNRPLDSSNLVMDSTPYVYFVNNGRRTIFQSTDILESWYGMTPPPEVTRVGDDVIARFEIAGNAFIREGTFVVRSLSSPQLYWVGQMGTLYAIPEETMRQWVMLMPLDLRIRVLPDYLLAGYHMSDMPIGLMPNKVVDGMLFARELITSITPGGWNTTLYLVDHGQARVVTPAGLAANGLRDIYCLYRSDLTVGPDGVLPRGPDLIENDYWLRFNPGTHP